MKLNGSPKITKGDLVFGDGQPEMDEGVATSITTSLLSREGWWGELISPLAGGYVEASDAPITASMLDRLEATAEASLSWIKKKRLAKSIKATCTNPIADKIKTVIEIDGEKVEL